MLHAISTKQVISFIYKMSRPFPWGLTIMFSTATMWAIDLSVRPYFLKILIDRAGEVSSYDRIDYLWLPAAAYFFMLFLTTTVFRLYEYFVEVKMLPRLRENIANSSMAILLEQSHSFSQSHFAGSLANKINDLTSSIPDILQKIERFFRYGMSISIAAYMLWIVNIKFAILMFTWAAAFVGITLLALKRIVRLADIWSEWGSTITGKVVDVLSNILPVRLFSKKGAEKSSLHHIFDETVKAEQKLQMSYFYLWFSYGYSATFMVGLSLYFLIMGRQEGWITIGDFALVLTINMAIVDFLWELTQELSQFSKLFGKVTQALRTLVTIPEIRDKPDAKPLVVHKGKIVFDSVHFHYKGADPLFQDKSVTLLPGQKVGLVGYSGGGKTTFVNLILRLFDVTSGRILIDNQDIRDVTQDSLHRAIGMIPQDPSLFHRSLKDNIAYGGCNPTDAEIIDAAKKAYAHQFILELPEGYASLVGERGVKLSGGQRQRIAIARAFLKNAPILILDEATSQLDSVTENYIQESLRELMHDKTTIVIAHRLSTLLHMDRILVFDRGKIIEDGSHQELLAKEGLYKTLWNAQVGGFLPNEKRT